MRRATALRAGALLALGLFAALHWATLLEPSRPGPLLGGVGVGALLALGLLALRAAPGPARLPGAVLLALLAVGGVLVLAGVPPRFLDPDAWDDLAGGLAQGIGAVGSVRVPYRGAEEWTRVVLLAGGIALAPLAALLAFRPRRGGGLPSPVPAVVALGVLYGVPAVQREAEQPWLAGAVLALLLAAVLWLERVERPHAPLAAGLVAVAAAGGLVVAPRVDADGPLLDYEQIAQSLSEAGTERFDWNHSYGPLDWPREGREVLRVRAREEAYWKAVDLGDFTGVRWQVSESGALRGGPAPRRRDAWRQRIRVTVRNLRSPYFIGAGTTLQIVESPDRRAFSAGVGSFRTGDAPLRKGHTYVADVYAPRPEREELDGPPGPYADAATAQLSMALPDARPSMRTQVVFPDWNEQELGAEPVAYAPRSDGIGTRPDAARALAAAGYGGVHDLALRLREGADTPYDYTRRVLAHLADGYVYTERPPRRELPLAAFLLRDRRGYCQQFSGAMALLLRMGGVPARVASGFAPGSLDRTRGEYVVRDFDAHSWVEAWFPGTGWVTFDPTPAVSPARSQIGDRALEGELSLGAGVAPGDSPSDPARGGPAPMDEAASGGSTVSGVVGATVAAAVLGIGALLLVRRRRRRRDGGPTDDVLLAELYRALARSGRPAAPGTTLAALERALAGTPGRAYVHALAERRYGYATAGPTPLQRAALRRTLADRLGALGALRAWWALPPQL